MVLLVSGVAVAQSNPPACTPSVDGLRFCALARPEASPLPLLDFQISNPSNSPIQVLDFRRVPSAQRPALLHAWVDDLPCQSISAVPLSAEWYSVLKPGTSITFSSALPCRPPSGSHRILVAVPFRSPCVAEESDVALANLCSTAWPPAVHGPPSL